MRIRIALAAALTLAALGGPAMGSGHCDSPIYLFSYVATPADDPLDPNRKLGSPTITSSAFGCLIVGEDVPETPIDESDTDVIYPGSDTLVVRWLEAELPVSGTIEIGGATHELTFYRTTNGLTSVTDSHQVRIDPALSVSGGGAKITVCRESGGCEIRTYRTLA